MDPVGTLFAVVLFVPPVYFLTRYLIESRPIRITAARVVLAVMVAAFIIWGFYTFATMQISPFFR